MPADPARASRLGISSAVSIRRQAFATAAARRTARAASFGLLAARVEAHVFAPREPRGARGAAIDAGGPNGVVEHAVRLAVPALHCRPAFGVACERRGVGLFPRHYEIHDSAPFRLR